MCFDKEQLRAMFYSGCDTNIPKKVIEDGPIAIVDYIDNKFEFYYHMMTLGPDLSITVES